MQNRISYYITPLLFFILFGLSYLLPIYDLIWLIRLIIVLAVYFIIVFSIKPLRRELNRLKLGEINKRILFGIILIVIISSSALTIWTRLNNPNLEHFISAIPNFSTEMFVLLILFFSIFNAIAEELVFRGILWDFLEKLFPNIKFIIVFQAFLFGIAHYKGFPSGVIPSLVNIQIKIFKDRFLLS